jgi:hypothetical protein
LQLLESSLIILRHTDIAVANRISSLTPASFTDIAVARMHTFTIVQPSVGEFHVTYTSSEIDCGKWLLDHVYTVEDFVLSFDTESLSESNNIEILILSTATATLVIHVTYFEFADSSCPETGCLRKLLLDPRITFVGVEINDDVYSVCNRLKDGLFTSEADVLSDRTREPESLKGEVKVCDCAFLAKRVYKDDPSKPQKMGLAGLALYFYPDVPDWKPKKWKGYQQKQQLFMWDQNPLQQWQIEYCAKDGWGGRAVYDALASKASKEQLNSCLTKVTFTY